MNLKCKCPLNKNECLDDKKLINMNSNENKQCQNNEIGSKNDLCDWYGKLFELGIDICTYI